MSGLEECLQVALRDADGSAAAPQTVVAELALFAQHVNQRPAAIQTG